MELPHPDYRGQSKLANVFSYARDKMLEEHNALEERDTLYPIINFCLHNMEAETIHRPDAWYYIPPLGLKHFDSNPFALPVLVARTCPHDEQFVDRIRNRQYKYALVLTGYGFIIVHVSTTYSFRYNSIPDGTPLPEVLKDGDGSELTLLAYLAHRYAKNPALQTDYWDPSEISAYHGNMSTILPCKYRKTATVNVRPLDPWNDTYDKGIVIRTLKEPSLLPPPTIN